MTETSPAFSPVSTGHEQLTPLSTASELLMAPACETTMFSSSLSRAGASQRPARELSGGRLERGEHGANPGIVRAQLPGLETFRVRVQSHQNAVLGRGCRVERRPERVGRRLVGWRLALLVEQVVEIDDRFTGAGVVSTSSCSVRNSRLGQSRRIAAHTSASPDGSVR